MNPGTHRTLFWLAPACLSVFFLAGCGGGGSSSSSIGNSGGSSSGGTPSDCATLSSDQQQFENTNLEGGDFSVSWNFPFGGGTLVSGTNYIFSTSNGLLPASPSCGAQIQAPVQASLDNALTVPGSSNGRYLINGQFYAQSSTGERRISYTGTAVHVDYLATDNTTVVGSAEFHDYSSTTLSGYMNNSPEELMAAYPIDYWINFHNFVGNAQWQNGAAYMKREGNRVGDTVLAEDCNNTNPVVYSTSTTPTPCRTGTTLNSFFPITLLDGSNPSENYFSGDGTIASSKDGVRMWIANSPLSLADAAVTSYRVFYELNGNVYTGLLQKDGTAFNYRQYDGTVVNYYLSLNATAVSSIRSGIITGAVVPGSSLGSSAEITTSIDMFGIGGHGVDGALAPADLHTHYNVPSTVDGTGQTIAIIDAPGSGNVLNDLNVFSEYYQLPQCNTANPCFSHIDLSNGAAVSSANDWGFEVELDTQMVHAMAPGATILLVTAASSSNTDLMAAVSRAASTPGVTAISMSFGNTALSMTTQESQDALFSSWQSGQGLVFFASSGDGAHQPNASYPAVSPYVTGVGGTRINAVSTTSGVEEVAWQFSGGGTSATTAMPAWQSSQLSSATISANYSMRAEPDVAAVADYQHSAVAIYYKDEWAMAGGTSVAAPIWGGISALLGEYLVNKSESLPTLVKGTAGGFNGLLYESRLTQGSNPAFYDIVSGSNNLTTAVCLICSAGTGYDNITGLGAPNVANLLSYF